MELREGGGELTKFRDETNFGVTAPFNQHGIVPNNFCSLVSYLFGSLSSVSCDLILDPLPKNRKHLKASRWKNLNFIFDE